MPRLPTMRARFGEVADAAQREQLTYRGFLAELLTAECDDRDRRRSARRITAAGFPREKWLQDLDYAANLTRTSSPPSSPSSPLRVGDQERAALPDR